MVNLQLAIPSGPLPMVFVEFEGKSFQADATGRVTLPSPTVSTTVKVWAQNHATRMLNGEKFNIAYTQDIDIRQQRDFILQDENGAFRLVNQFGSVLNDLRNRVPAWATLGFGFSADRRVEVSWRDQFPGPSLSFVEPTSGLSTHPPQERLWPNNHS